MENMNKCPCCSHHCDRNNLQCGKGEAYFNGETTPDSSRVHENHGGKHHNHQEGERRCRHGGEHRSRQEGECCRHGGERHGHQEGQHGDQRRGHRRPEFPAGSLAELLAKCGHRLFHSGDESMFAALTVEESDQLKKLLSKLISE